MTNFSKFSRWKVTKFWTSDWNYYRPNFLPTKWITDLFFTTKVARTIKIGKTTITIIRNFSKSALTLRPSLPPPPGALSYAFGKPPSPSRRVAPSGWPHVITLFFQHLVSLLFLSSKMSILKRKHTLQAILIVVIDQKKRQTWILIVRYIMHY